MMDYKSGDTFSFEFPSPYGRSNKVTITDGENKFSLRETGADWTLFVVLISTLLGAALGIFILGYSPLHKFLIRVHVIVTVVLVIPVIIFSMFFVGYCLYMLLHNLGKSIWRFQLSESSDLLENSSHNYLFELRSNDRIPFVQLWRGSLFKLKFSDAFNFPHKRVTIYLKGKEGKIQSKNELLYKIRAFQNTENLTDYLPHNLGYTIYRPDDSPSYKIFPYDDKHVEGRILQNVTNFEMMIFLGYSAILLFKHYVERPSASVD